MTCGQTEYLVSTSTQLYADYPYMTEPVPLCAALSVHGVEVIVRQVLRQLLDLVNECLASECRLGRRIERHASSNQHMLFDVNMLGYGILHRDDLASPDLFRSGRNSSGSKKIDPPKLRLRSVRP